MSDELRERLLSGKPVRFLAVEWSEDWEFDNPSVLLEPVFRYSPNGTDLETLVEDAALDLGCDLEEGKTITTVMDEAEVKEFDWRGWTLDAIREAAEATLRGEKVKLGSGDHVGVREAWMVFTRTGHGVFLFDEVDKPAGGVGCPS